MSRKDHDDRLGRDFLLKLLWLIGAFFLGIFFGPGMAGGQIAGRPCIPPPTLPITGTRNLNVATEAQLQNAIGNLQLGDTIVLANGTYSLISTLYVDGIDNISLRGASGCDNVVLVGRGMDNANYGSVPHGIWSNARNIMIAHLTIRDVYYHPIIVDAGAQSRHKCNVKYTDIIKAPPLLASRGRLGVKNSSYKA
jgi:hypothetical protein